MLEYMRRKSNVKMSVWIVFACFLPTVNKVVERYNKELCIVCIELNYIVLYCIVLNCIELNWIALHCIALYCIVMYYIVLHCIILYCIVLYCIVLYCCIVWCCMVVYGIELYYMHTCMNRYIIYKHTCTPITHAYAFSTCCYRWTQNEKN